MHLTKEQIEIILRLADGWELHASYGKYTMRQPNISKEKMICAAAVMQLQAKKLLKVADQKQDMTWLQLTTDGMRMVEYIKNIKEESWTKILANITALH